MSLGEDTSLALDGLVGQGRVKKDREMDPGSRYGSIGGGFLVFL